jgi:hypothetical protein
MTDLIFCIIREPSQREVFNPIDMVSKPSSKLGLF